MPVPAASPARPRASADPSAASLHASFEREQAGVVERRLRLVAGMILAAMAVAGPVECLQYPARRAITTTAVGFEAFAAVAALALLRLPALRARARLVALGFTLAVACTIAWHIATELSPPTRLATSYVCLLTGIVILLPWGWRPHLALTVACATAFAVVAHAYPTPLDLEDLLHVTLMLLGTGTASVFAAGHLDRARHDAFVRAAQLEHSVERERAQGALLAAIERVQARFIGAEEPTAIFDDLLEDLLALTESAYGFIGEMVSRADGTPVLRLHAVTDIAWDAASRALIDRSQPLEFDRFGNLLGTVVTTGTTVIANAPATDPRRGGLPPGHPPLDAFLGLPLRHGTELVGMIGVANRPGGYDDALAAWLEPVLVTAGHLIAAARSVADRRQAETALWREAELTATLATAGRELLSSLDVPTLIERLGRLAAQTLTADVAAAVAWHADATFGDLVPAVGFTDEQAAEARRRRVPRVLVTTLLARAADPDVAELPDVAPETLAALGLPPAVAGRLVVLPLRAGGALVGVQLVGWRSGGAPLTESQQRVAAGLGRMAALALTNARLLADLQRANQLKSEFVSAMSHELRTPLNVILGYTEMAREADAPDERIALLDRIEQAGRDLLGLIEGTLEIGRIEAGVDDVRREAVPFAAYWDELGRACGRIPRHDGVAFRWGAAPDRTLGIDPRKVTMIVRNLVGNALKFTEAGAVDVGVEVVGDALVLTVRDTGIGIRPEDQAKIFEMFRQADGSETRRFGGTGLGLYLVRRFAAQLGGDVRVESAPGRGATFVVTLSTATESAAAGAAPADVAAPAPSA